MLPPGRSVQEPLRRQPHSHTKDALPANQNTSMRAPLLPPKHAQHPPQKAGSSAAFTLVELVIVLGIVLLMLGFAAPSVVGILKGKRVEQALAAVSDMLERSRMEAMSQNTYVWAGLCNISKQDPENRSGQDELWLLTFRNKNGDSRIPDDQLSPDMLPNSALRRVEGVNMIAREKLPERVAALFPSTGKDFVEEPPLKTGLRWAGAGPSTGRYFTRIILFTPRGEAILETGSTELPSPHPYLWLGLSRTNNGEPAPSEKDMAAVLVSGFSGRVTLVRP
jgi:Tfp pilus assembly protein FimT